MSNELKSMRELRRTAENMGFEVITSIGGGRHGQKLVLMDQDGKLHTIPVAGSTGHGKTHHTANAVAQLRRIIKGERI